MRISYSADLYVLLTIDGLYIFIPQSQIESVEIIADTHITSTTTGAVGWFSQGHGVGRDVPVFCLSKALVLQQDIPQSREYFVLLKSHDEQAPVGITCDEVENLNVKHEELFFQDLPAVMKNQGFFDSPIEQFLIYNNKVACVCTGEKLTDYIHTLSQRYIEKSADY